MPPVTARALVRLAVPAALSVILNNAFRVVDQHAAGWLGTDAQGAIGSMTFVLLLAFAAWGVVGLGVGPMVARATGAGDLALRRRVVGNALAGSVVVGVAVLGAGYIFADGIASMVGLEGEIADQAARYLRTLALVGLPLAVAPVIDGAFIAMGQTALPMALQGLATALNIVLNVLFIRYFGFGIEGLAVASGVSRLVAVLIGVWALVQEVQPKVFDLRPDGTLLRVLRVGWPVSANVAAYSLVYWALLRVAISPLGPEVNAALGIGFSALEGFTWPAFYGLSLAVASLVGRSLGAGRPDEAWRAVRLGMPLAVIAGGTAAVVFWFGAHPLCALFTDDPEVLEQAVLYARILAFSQIFVAVEALAEGVLEGAGDTGTVFWASSPFNVLRIPLAWLLATPLGWGAAGIWWAINFTTLLKAVVKGALVLRGKWTRVEV
jgi:putative MATE family efflux protein